jgi:hypothetical protein
MARNELSYAKSLYFCGVKTHKRQEVAGKSSVFRARNLLVEIYPDVCGSSNARKGSACETLTARIGIFICQKL